MGFGRQGGFEIAGRVFYGEGKGEEVRGAYDEDGVGRE